MGDLVVEIIAMGNHRKSGGTSNGFYTGPNPRLYAITWTGTPPATGTLGTGSAQKMRIGSFTPAIGNFGLGCGAGPLGINATGTGQINSSLVLNLQNGATGPVPGFIWMGTTSSGLYPFDLAGAGYPGCKLYTNFLVLFPVVVQGGVSNRIQLGIPADKSLICGQVFFQGLTIDPAAPSVEFSDFVRVLFGI
jgi:hypothetical protein